MSTSSETLIVTDETLINEFEDVLFNREAIFVVAQMTIEKESKRFTGRIRVIQSCIKHRFEVTINDTTELRILYDRNTKRVTTINLKVQEMTSPVTALLFVYPDTDK
jgi:hypothetical protein